MKKIKTFEGACKVLKLDPDCIPVLELIPEQHRKSVLAYYKLVIIAQALNEGWIPDWSDSSQLKYFPWFVASGSGFRYDVCVGWCTDTCVGSRLCFKSAELAEYAGTQFKKEYNDYIVFK